ncbi:uncharacterized protein YabE (DUF348 family) [Naumannella cuiyingiana]|uniref:Probable endolytic peptidoglycan transglycosylase RlpA n=1 Tax=Naumannella cuiyingiana TaxID=1347891 RepID=A0A7Z0IL71_9ACTN|nr:septal ring lytic transglycosylase RlpA family protein [Naumannella cuiyingiana]NYI71212.1 uncharacterized protein YabE (DUF348 family) [Naumannella cuiyingiana]
MSIAAGVLAASGGVFGAWTATAKTVDLTVDGVPTTLTTHDATVADVLAERGISYGARDEVAPAPQTPVTSGTQIVVRYSRNVTLNIAGGDQKVVPTTALTVGDLLDALRYREESRVSASRSTPIGRQGLSLDIAPARDVPVSVGGKPATTVVTTGLTVSDALTEAKIKFDGDDEILPAKDAKLDDLDAKGITVNVVEYKESEKKSDIDFETERRRTSELDEGETKVKTEGKKGVRVETIREKFVNGKSVEKKPKGKAKTEKEPVNKIVLVGTGDSDSDSSSSGGSGSGGSGSGGSGGSGSGGSGSGGSGDSEEADTSQSPASGNSCKASYYWEPQPTASGERFNPNAMTAAHKTLPLGTRIKVTNPSNGKTVVVRINDRGPYVSGRCLDLSKAAMEAIGGTSAGVITVKWDKL